MPQMRTFIQLDGPHQHAVAAEQARKRSVGGGFDGRNKSAKQYGRFIGDVTRCICSLH